MDKEDEIYYWALPALKNDFSEVRFGLNNICRKILKYAIRMIRIRTDEIKEIGLSIYAYNLKATHMDFMVTMFKEKNHGKRSKLTCLEMILERYLAYNERTINIVKKCLCILMQRICFENDAFYL